jgi:hypothetical protein
MRQFRQRARLWFAQQSIAQIKQRIASPLHTVVGLLPKCFQWVKVHLEYAPFGFVAWNITPSGSFLQKSIA